MNYKLKHERNASMAFSFRTRHVAVMASMFALIAMLAGCTPAETEAQQEPTVRPVKFHVVENFSGRFTASFPAVMQAAEFAELAFQTGGLLKKLPASDGLEVKKGDLLAKLDARDAQNSFNSAQAQYQNANTKYQRAARLMKENAISRSILEQRRSQRDTAKATLDSARKSLDDTELRAPYDGQVADVLVKNFQNVGAQQTILKFQSSGDVEAAINVPARLIAFIPQLEPVDPKVTLDVAPKMQIPAKFKEITLQADATTQTYRATFTFASPDNLMILPGMTGTVSTSFVTKDNEIARSVSVPLGAIVSESGDQFVWIIDKKSMTVSKRKIAVAKEQTGSEVRITAGLEPGELIAGAGASYLFEGMTVREWKP